MATLTVNGRKVKVDDSFLSLSPEQQEATVNEIAASMAGPETSFQDFGGVDKAIAESKPEVGVLEDIGKGAVGGVGRLVSGVAGLPGDLQRIAQAGNQFVKDKTGYGLPSDPSMLLPGSRDVQEKIEQHTGEFYKPQTKAGRLASALVEFAPGAMTGKGAVSRMANVLAPATGYTAATEAAKGTAIEPYAGMAGAVAGAFSPQVLARAISPLSVRKGIDPRDVQLLRGEGVNVTAGQATGRTGLQRFEARSGGGKYEDIIDRQGEQFTAAAMRRAGETTSRARPDDIKGAFDRIGNQFDDLAARNWGEFDGPFVQEIQRVRGDYQSLVPQSMQARIVDDVVQDIIDIHQQRGSALTGEQYQKFRSRLETAARNTSDTDVARALRGIRVAMDDMVERTIAKRNPSDLGAWKEARSQYRNMLAIEQAASSAGVDSARGIISPAQLANAVRNVHGRKNYARGQGDLSELARSGVAVLTKPNTSGTSENLSAMNIVAMLANAPMRGAARVALSRPGQRYLSNQIAGDYVRNLDSTRAGLLAALLAGQAGREPLRITVTPRQHPD